MAESFRLRRVVVTGMGLVSPFGAGVQKTWPLLISGQSALRPILGFTTDDLPCRIAGQLMHHPDLFDPADYISEKDRRRMDDFILYAMIAADEAIAHAGWAPQNDHDADQTGVMIGSGIGGLPEIERSSLLLAERGPRRVSPFFIPSSLINLASGQISIKHGFRGPNHAVVTACASGSHAIGDAARLIQMGDADVMVAGGAEAAICRVGMAGFASAKALSTGYNDTPEKASRPWDRGRDGFVMGEGAGILVLEELEHARARGAKIYAELTGYGLSGDAHHITAPAEDGDGAYRCMRMALKRAALPVEAIDYINAHGTSTPAGDVIEVRAVKKLFGDHAYKVAMSSTKSAIGHLLGAAGAVEAVFSILALNTNIIPPTLNLDDPDEECDLNFVPHQAQEKVLTHVLSNSFGFGGTNASLVFSKL
jgi:3-oxoacyl-[acyl-carrier-protein] synthase II